MEDYTLWSFNLAISIILMVLFSGINDILFGFEIGMVLVNLYFYVISLLEEKW